MDLILWRHAEAAAGVPDAQRPLTVKGARQAAAMARWMQRHVPGPVTVLASPALRAQQTARAYADAVETRAELALGASPARLLRAAGWPDGKGAVVIVGHQPGLGAAAALALTGKPSPWRLKRGALWWLRSTGDGPPLVVAVITPRLARAARGKDGPARD